MGRRFEYVAPSACCVCLGSPEVERSISNFGGGQDEFGNRYTSETKFTVPICRRCQRRIRFRWLVAVVVVAAFLIASQRVPEASTARTVLAVVAGLGLVGLFFVGIGGFFEPARYDERARTLRFRNKEYQRRFDEAN